MVKSIATAERKAAFFKAIAQALSANPQASYEQLAQAASISRRTLYRIAPSRDALTRLLHEEALSATDRTLSRADVRHAEPVAALRTLTCEFIRDSALYRFWVGEDDQGGVEAHYEHYQSEMTVLLQRAQAAGIIRRDVPALWLIDIYDGLLSATNSINRRLKQEPEALAAFVVDQFLNGAAGSASRSPSPCEGMESEEGRD